MEDVRLYFRFARAVVRTLAVFFFKTRCFGVRHIPREGGVLLVSNHQSFLDPIVATIALPRESCYMARESLFKNRFFSALITSVNAFPVKRGAADVGAIKESLRRLKRGMPLLVFAEGTRTKDGRIGPMLPGLAAIAQKARVPVVPVLIDGMVQCWPRDAAWPRPGNVIVEYGPPILPEAYADLSGQELMNQIRDQLISMQHRWHRRVPERRLEWFEPMREANEPSSAIV